MNVIEGMCYAFIAALTVLILGLPLSVAVCAEVSKKSFAGTVAVPPCAVWHGGDPVCLDGAQAEKAILSRADAGDGVIDRFLFSISRQQINISQQSNCFGISNRL